MERVLLRPGLCRLKQRTTSFFGFNLFYVLERLPCPVAS